MDPDNVVAVDLDDDDTYENEGLGQPQLEDDQRLAMELQDIDSQEQENAQQAELIDEIFARELEGIEEQRVEEERRRREEEDMQLARELEQEGQDVEEEERRRREEADLELAREIQEREQAAGEDLEMVEGDAEYARNLEKEWNGEDANESERLAREYEMMEKQDEKDRELARFLQEVEEVEARACGGTTKRPRKKKAVRPPSVSDEDRQTDPRPISRRMTRSQTKRRQDSSPPHSDPGPSSGPPLTKNVHTGSTEASQPGHSRPNPDSSSSSDSSEEHLNNRRARHRARGASFSDDRLKAEGTRMDVGNSPVAQDRLRRDIGAGVFPLADEEEEDQEQHCSLPSPCRREESPAPSLVDLDEDHLEDGAEDDGGRKAKETVQKAKTLWQEVRKNWPRRLSESEKRKIKRDFQLLEMERKLPRFRPWTKREEDMIFRYLRKDRHCYPALAVMMNRSANDITTRCLRIKEERTGQQQTADQAEVFIPREDDDDNDDDGSQVGVQDDDSEQLDDLAIDPLEDSIDDINDAMAKAFYISPLTPVKPNKKKDRNRAAEGAQTKGKRPLIEPETHPDIESDESDTGAPPSSEAESESEQRRGKKRPLSKKRPLETDDKSLDPWLDEHSPDHKFSWGRLAETQISCKHLGPKPRHCVHYHSVKMDFRGEGEIQLIKIGDCVAVRPIKGKSWIAQILDFWQEHPPSKNSSGMCMKIRYFDRADDTLLASGLESEYTLKVVSRTLENELFLTDDMCVNNVEVIVWKVLVYRYDEIADWSEFAYLDRNSHFFVRFKYVEEEGYAFQALPADERLSEDILPLEHRIPVVTQVEMFRPSKKAEEGRFALSLFAGIGGLDIGMTKAGIQVKWAIEKDAKAAETLRHNFPHLVVIQDDAVQVLRKIKAGKGAKDWPGKDDVFMIFGGPPCQGFSRANKNRRFRDPRNKLVRIFVNYVQYFHPVYFLMENVRGLLEVEQGCTIPELLVRIQPQGYQTRLRLVNALLYGVPQMRVRVFIVGALPQDSEGRHIPLPDLPPATHSDGRTFARSRDFPYATFEEIVDDPKSFVTCGDAISDLPELESGASDHGPMRVAEPENEFQQAMQEIVGGWAGADPSVVTNHACRDFNKYTYEEIKGMRPAACLRHHKVYHTATTSPSWQRVPVLHYSQKRYLSIREWMRCQTFPNCFELLGDSLKDHMRQIGNAVPPLLAQAVATGFIKSWTSCPARNTTQEVIDVD